MRVRRSLLALLVLLFTVLIVPARSSVPRVAPSNPHQAHAGHGLPYMQQTNAGQPVQLDWANRRNASKLAVAVDGSQNPELIPDAVAYEHFIRATARSASAEDIKRRDVLLGQAGLRVSERLVYMQALGNVAAQLEAVKQQRSAAGPSASAAMLQNLKQTEVRVVAEAEVRVRQALSPVAMAKLEAHIQHHVKRRIKIFRSPMQ